MIIFLYKIFAIFLLPVHICLLIIRLYIKKEDINRIQERFGIATHQRPNGKLIWIHAASIGESKVMLTLMNALNSQNEVYFLLTSGTLSSANILKGYLSKNAIHQFLPIDNPIFIWKFLYHWKPNLAMIIESEIWPCLITQTAKFCKILLVNGRLSDQSFYKWLRLKPFWRAIIVNFSELLLQSKNDLDKFYKLGSDNAIYCGNLKFSNKKPYVNQEYKNILLNTLREKRIIFAVSTHKADEQVIFKIINQIKQRYHNLYFIIAPRHPERTKEIEVLCIQNNLKFSFKSENLVPNANDDIYIYNAFGDIGALYDVADITFVGGSFDQGGHNPIEPLYFDNAIIFGPDMTNIKEVASMMLNANAAIEISTSQQLLEKLDYLLKHSEILQHYKTNAKKIINQQVLDKYLGIIKTYL